MAEPRAFNGYTSEMRKGITLVEASAGTGKTFSITMIVLRAVTELGIPVNEILVVTFTIAATDELKERIRRRLSAARTILKQLPGGTASPDEELEQWAAGLLDRELAMQRLESALLDIDQAAIHTIHGFCQRTLKEQALESDHLFDVELLPDVSKIRDQIVQDFWRDRVYPLEPSYGRVIVGEYPTPYKLYGSVAGAEDMRNSLVPDPEPVSLAVDKISKTYGKLKEWFDLHGAALKKRIEAEIERGVFKTKFVSTFDSMYSHLLGLLALNMAPRIQEIGWLAGPVMEQALNGNKVRKSAARDLLIGELALPGPILADYCSAAAGLLLYMRLELAETVRQQLPIQLKQRNSLGYDDLVTSLASALKGSGGTVLRDQVGKRYQAALIDEFQDTDGAQWLIFSNLFGAGKHYLYLIGDPKQAIYRFRGADINSYFAARAAADTHYTLANNFRSHPALMDGINDLLEGASIGGLEYQPLTAARPEEASYLVGEPDSCVPDSVVYCQLDESGGGDGRWSSSAAGDVIRNWICAEIVSLTGPQSQVLIGQGKQGGERCVERVRPADIAILVRANWQADAYQNSLRMAGIPAVVSSKIPVYQTTECADMLILLQAISTPGDGGLLKRGLSLDWFGLSGEEHFRVCTDENEFSIWLDRFQSYHDTWQETGFLPMFRQLLETENVYLSLSRFKAAERRVTNIEHLAELVQKAELDNRFRSGQTVQWLQEAVGGSSSSEEVELRLESDGEAVTILTMHGAKGLEFPIVFCPSLLTGSYQKSEKPLAISHREDGTRICDLGSATFEQNRERSLAEERDEDMRLAYVSVTRATLSCYLFWADVKGRKPRPDSFESPLGKLLFPDGQVEYASQRERLQKRCEHRGCGYRHVEISRVAQTVSTAPEPVHEFTAKWFERSLYTPRTRTSFSGLSKHAPDHPSSDLAKAFDETAGWDENGSEPADRTGPAPVDQLPGGVRFGNLVHDILEKCEFNELGAGTWDRELAQSLRTHYNLDVEQAPLDQLLTNAVITKLLPAPAKNPFCLYNLGQDKVIKEMEFTLPLDRIDTKKINHLLGQDPAVAPLEPRTIEGYVTGYIDLVCLHDGRYYVIDYKTNRLGDRTSDYQPTTLTEAMRSHNYGLQYWLYSLVVHRHLSCWHASYSFAEHFGGVYYLFLRGMEPQTPGNGIYHTMPDQEILEKLDRYIGGGRDVR